MGQPLRKSLLEIEILNLQQKWRNQIRINEENIVKLKRIQERLAFMEAEMRRDECETRSINYYLAEDQKLPTSS